MLLKLTMMTFYTATNRWASEKEFRQVELVMCLPKDRYLKKLNVSPCRAEIPSSLLRISAPLLRSVTIFSSSP